MSEPELFVSAEMVATVEDNMNKTKAACKTIIDQWSNTLSIWDSQAFGKYVDHMKGMVPLPKREAKPREIPKISFDMYRNIINGTS